MASIDARATTILEELGATSYPVDPVAIASLHDIGVHAATFKNNRISGAISKRGSETRIFVNVSDSSTRKRFTIAHELGHFFLHFPNIDGEVVDMDVDLFRGSSTVTDVRRRKQEREANRFAAALLMPAGWVKKEWSASRSISATARAFGVSDDAMFLRLEELGLV